MAKRIKRGEEVVVLAGSEKGKRGKVLSVKFDVQKILVEGIKIVKKHQKKRSEADKGGIIEEEAFIDYSNVMIAEKFDARKK